LTLDLAGHAKKVWLRPVGEALRGVTGPSWEATRKQKKKSDRGPTACIRVSKTGPPSSGKADGVRERTMHRGRKSTPKGNVLTASGNGAWSPGRTWSGGKGTDA